MARKPRATDFPPGAIVRLGYFDAGLIAAGVSSSTNFDVIGHRNECVVIRRCDGAPFRHVDYRAELLFAPGEFVAVVSTLDLLVPPATLLRRRAR